MSWIPESYEDRLQEDMYHAKELQLDVPSYARMSKDENFDTEHRNPNACVSH